MTTQEKYQISEYYRRQGLLRNFGRHVVAADDNAKHVKSEAEIKEKINNLKDGEILVLDSNIEITSDPITVTSGNTATVNLNGKTISTTDSSTQDSVFVVANGAKLIINDATGTGMVETNKTVAVKLTNNATYDPSNIAELEINGGNFNGKYYSLSGNGSRKNTKITINGGVFTQTSDTTQDEAGAAMYIPQYGELVINGGTFIGQTGVYIKNGKTTINGGFFRGIGTKYPYCYYGSGMKSTGDALVIDNCGYPADADISITINGGTFETANSDSVHSYVKQDDGTQTGDYERVVGFIKGGFFNKELDSSLIASGYTQTKEGEYWIVK